MARPAAGRRRGAGKAQPEWCGTTRLELVPRFAFVAKSSLPHAGQGLFSAVELPPGFELGQYVGKVSRGTDFYSGDHSAYTWEVTPTRPRIPGEQIWVDGRIDFSLRRREGKTYRENLAKTALSQIDVLCTKFGSD